MAGCMDTAIEISFDKFTKNILGQKEHAVRIIDGQMVFDSFSKTYQSAGSLDGGHPKELSLLSKTMRDNVAIMPYQNEEGAPWPRSATHARVVYLEKEGAVVGEVMSYRPLTITAPIYRCWATMRLATMEEWIGSLALSVMHAGVPEMGAVDAWHTALTNIEEFKLNGAPIVEE